MAKTPMLDDWQVGQDDQGEPILIGRLDDAPWESPPVARIDLDADVAHFGDGSTVCLGRPARPIDPNDPLRPDADVLEHRIQSLRPVLERLKEGQGPTAAERERAPILRNWTLADRAGSLALAGFVENHPRFVDGEWITTSALLWLAPDLTAARTVSRWYRLGEPWVRGLGMSGE